MIKKILGLGFVFFSLGQIKAQTANFSGRVLIADGDEALQGVAVIIENSARGTVSDATGYFSLQGLSAGSYQLLFKHIGMENHKLEVELFTGENDLGLIRLSERSTLMQEASVSGASMTGGHAGLQQIAGSAHYLGPKELARQEYNDINRVLRQVPGVNIVEEDGFGLRPNIGLRGTGTERSTKITIMEDGILLAPAPYSAPAAYYFPNVGRMEGVEVRKGSSQIEYGPYTTGGAINFISTSIPEEFSAKLNVLAGNFGQRRLETSVGQSFQNFGFVLESYQASADGFKQLDNDGPTGFDISDYQAKFRINTGPEAKLQQSLTFKLGQTINNSDETYLGLTRADFAQDPYRRYAGSAADRMETEQRQYSLRYHIQPGDRLQVSLTAYRNEFKRNWYKLDKLQGRGSSASIAEILDRPSDLAGFYNTLTGNGSDTLTLKNNNREYYSQGLQAQARYRLSEGKWQQVVKFGLRLHEDAIDRFQWVDDYRMQEGNLFQISAGTPGTESNRIQSARATAAFAEYRMEYGRFTFTPGLRYEKIWLDRRDYGKADPEREGTNLSERENQIDVWIPGMGLSYRWNENSSVFVGVHKGFSPPGASPDTRAEESINYELGSRFTALNWQWNATIFFNDYQNLLGSDLAAIGGAGSVQLFNGGRARVAGLEAEAQGFLFRETARRIAVPLGISYTYTHATFAKNFESDFDAWGNVSSGDFLPYLAPHMLNVQLGFDWRRFSLNNSWSYLTAMRTVAGQGKISPEQEIPSQFMLDLSASYRINRYLSAFASLRNLTDEVNLVATRPAGLRPAMPRSYLMGIRAQF